MLDQNKINQFTQRAKARGFNDAQIAAEIARKKKELETQAKPTVQQPVAPVAPTATPSAGMDTNPTFQQPVAPPVEPKAPIERKKPTGALGVLDTATEFLFGKTKKFMRKIAGSAIMGKQLDIIEESNKGLQDQATQLTKRAMTEKDPAKKKLYLDMARKNTELASKNIEDILGGFEENTGMSVNDPSLQDNGKRIAGIPTQYIQEAAGVAGEVGSFFVPVTKAAKGAGLAQKVIAGAKTGAKIGAIQGATNPDVELDDITGRLKQTLTDAGFGAVTGGVFTAAYELPKAAIKKVVNTKAAQDTIRGIFKIAPSEMKKFRKVNGMDFGEEILARDGKSISGMGTEEIADYMATRKEAAQKAVSNALKGSKKTIQTSGFVEMIDEKIAALDPKKGNVNTEGAIATLKSIKATLKKNPKALTLETANQIKRQLQDAGSAAFSPTGKATPTSEAFAEVSGWVKRAIEKEAKGVKEANKLVQLYDLAQKSITTEGDRAANKVASGNLQKFIHSIPTVAGAAGGYALGGGGITGIATGVIGANMVSGLQGTMRNKFLSPQFQTQLAANIQKAVEAAGNPTAQQVKQITDRVVQEGIKQLSRSVTSGGDAGVVPSGDPNAQIQEANNEQLPADNQTQQQQQSTHDTSVSQAFGSAQTPFAQPGATITGRTIDQHLRALSKATAAGDKKAIAEIKAQYAIEKDYQDRKAEAAKPVKKSKEQLAREQTGFNVDRALELLTKNPKIKMGVFAAPLEEAKSIINKGDPDTIEFNRVISELKATIAKERGGTSFTPNEEKMLDAYTPKVGDSKQQIMTKLNLLKEKIDFFKGTEVESSFEDTMGGFATP